MDSGADITIMGGELFKTVATTCKLKKRDFKPADKVPRTYNQQTFKLDGKMDLELAFGGRVMRTPVYVKMDAYDQLLLSEGVCRQLGIIQYHPDVWGGSKKKNPVQDTEAKVPLVRVDLVRSVAIPPQQAAMVEVHVTGDTTPGNSWYVEQDPDSKESNGMQVEDTLLQPDQRGHAWTTQSILQVLLNR